MATFPFSALPARMRRLAGGVDAATAAVMRSVALQVQAEVARATPVDQGQARFNWVVSVNSENLTFTPIAFYPKNTRAFGQGVSEQTALAASRIQAFGDVGPVRRSATGLVYHVQNNAPYIVRLNNGWVRQTPAAFVERGIRRAIALYQQINVNYFAQTLAAALNAGGSIATVRVV